MSTVSKAVESSKEYANNIIGHIKDILSSNDVTYTSNDKSTELTIKGCNKDSVFKTIYNNLSVPKPVFMVLVDIKEVGDTIYIRQKSK